MYEESAYLQLSGLQHFAFCRRQWALIHIEQQWQENVKTAEGEVLHQRVHTEGLTEKRGCKLTIRGLRVASAKLGVSGCCDLVEFSENENGVYLVGREGRWQPVPVEYKRGLPKVTDADRLQLCCQAMCLEEMLCCEIQEGAIFYGETRRREKVEMTIELREKVKCMLREMHDYFAKGHTPRGKRSKSCNACSLKEICLPMLSTTVSASDYVKARLAEEDA